jgi:hypothetical protein
MIKKATINELREEAALLEQKLQAINMLIGLYVEMEAAEAGEAMSVVPMKKRGRKAQHA